MEPSMDGAAALHARHHSNHGCDVLLMFLNPADVAALRLVSRSWQALVDSCLAGLHPFCVRGDLAAFAATPCVSYRSLFQQAAVRHHALDFEPPAGIRFIAGQFSALRTLSVDCVSKGAGDFEALRCLHQLRRLQLLQFPFSDDALATGLAHCCGLVALHLEGSQAMLHLRSLRHLQGATGLQELVLQPRGYVCTPLDAGQGLFVLGQLNRLTRLLLLTALKPPRYVASGEAGSALPEAWLAPAAANGSAAGEAGGARAALAAQLIWFDAAAVDKLSASLGMLTQLKVLRLTGLAAVPPSIAGLTHLRELSLERLWHISRSDTSQLTALQQLTGLTLLLSAEALQQQQHRLQQLRLRQQMLAAAAQQAAGAGAAAQHAAQAAASHLDANADAAAASMDAIGSGVQSLGQLLAALPALQETMLGAALVSHRLAVTGSITPHLVLQAQRSSGGSVHAGGGVGSWGGQGVSGRRFGQQEGAGVAAYVCPTKGWHDLAGTQGLQHAAVEARSWHTATLLSHYASAEAAIASALRWQAQQHPQGARCSGQLTDQGSSCCDVGVFLNHPEHGFYLPSLPLLLVLCLRPCMGGLRPEQRQAVLQSAQALLQLLGGAAHSATASTPLGIGGLLLRPLAGDARCQLLAQLRAGLHPSSVLHVLSTGATGLTKLELTVDQSWPPGVLGSLGRLQALRHLSVLKLDCGRQQPPEEMWHGLSSLAPLRWLCLRWLDTLPLWALAPLTNLAALQLKNIDRPPGAAELAEALYGMPHLTALAIEGALIDATGGDWLRDLLGLLRHGRWTSSWVEHLLCRQYHLRVLGSTTAALWMTAVLHSNKLPEMLASAALAWVAGSAFVVAVAAALVQMMWPGGSSGARACWSDAYDIACSSSSSSSSSSSGQQGPEAGSTRGGVVATASSASRSSSVSGRAVEGGQAAAHMARAHAWLWRVLWHAVWLLAGGWLWLCVRTLLLPYVASLVASHTQRWWHDLQQQPLVQQLLPALQAVAGSDLLRGALLGGSNCSSTAPGSGEQRADCARAAADAGDAGAAAAGGDTSATTTGSAAATSASTSSPLAAIEDPGAAFRRLRLLSLRRCTLSHSSSSLSEKMWQLNYMSTQARSAVPGLVSRGVAALLAGVFWPLAVASALSRIAADSSSGKWRFGGGLSLRLVGGSASGAAGAGHGGGSMRRNDSAASIGSGAAVASSGHFAPKSRFAAWAWAWDLLCGLLGRAANRVEGAALSFGPVVAVAAALPALRALDLTWLNLEPWELHAVVQLRQLHYLGLSRQQVAAVMSREAVFARNCSRGLRAAVAGARGGGRRHDRAAGGGGGGSVVWRCVGWLAAGARLLLAAWWWACCAWWWPFGRRGGRAGSSRSSDDDDHDGVDAQDSAAGVAGRQHFASLAGMSSGWPEVVLVEAPSGFDEVIERELCV